jgi:FlaG/FlaF family flagellin (archaellin)
MVAITVILAAVIGTFVLGLGDQVSNSAPQASFQYEFNMSNGSATGGASVTITHTGGDTIEGSSLGVNGDSGGVGEITAWPSTVQTGNYSMWNDVDNGETIRVVWTNPSGGSTNTIAQQTAPA